MREIRLRIDSSLEAVRQIGSAVRALCREMGVSESDAAEVELACVEGANNSIKHAYGGKPGSHVDFVAVFDESGAEIEISDTGTPIAPEVKTAERALPAFDRADRQSLPEGGMGLPIMNHVMDAVTFHRKGGRNSLRMTRRWRHQG